ncbi:MAG: DUF58 domain-containing protein [Micropruina sp.]|uniref:DUF58 domain-containing protein n=1 Tax=Micropruina sp. TaxID=2737536 RepID=UPI0039E2FDC5
MIRLTSRGLGLVTVAVALLIAAAATGLRSLAWPGGLLLGLVAAGAVLAWFSARQPQARRTLHPDRVAAGTPVRVVLDLERDSIGLGAWSIVEETLPAPLGGAPAIAVPSGWGRLHSQHHYRLTPTLRGRYRIGPSRWATTDPLGLAGTRRRMAGSSLLTVTPAVHRLGDAIRGAGTGLSGDAAHRRSSVLGADDALIREYRPRDELRRIHWPSTARTGTLMVRREEHAWEPSALILLDNRSAGHSGEGAASSFEWAVSAAASIAVHLLDAGYDVELTDADGAAPPAERDTIREALLDRLTDIAPSAATELAGLRADGGVRGQLLIAVIGRLTPADAVALTSLRRDGRLCRAIVLQPAEPGTDDPAEVLVANGWHVVGDAAARSVPDAWAELERGAVR